jgi:predicted nucleic acid-binding protein
LTQYFIDTNILWWYLSKNSKHHQKVKIFLDELILNTANTFIVNEIILLELFHILVKRLGQSGVRIAQAIIDYKFTFLKIHFHSINKDTINNILDLIFKYGTTTTIGGRDSTVINTMQIHNLTHLITDDQGYLNVENLQVHSPFLMESS